MIWRTTVTDLLTIFRNALTALVPQMEAARIAWRDESAYDDWDEIAQTLYDKIVVQSIRWALSEPHRDGFRLPAYGLYHGTYEDTSVILVVPQSATGIFVFHSFATKEEPFDQIRTKEIDENGAVISESLFPYDLGGTTFAARMKARFVTELVVDV